MQPISDFPKDKPVFPSHTSAAGFALAGATYSRRFAHDKLGLVLAKGDYQGFHHGSDGFFIGTGTEPGLNKG